MVSPDWSKSHIGRFHRFQLHLHLHPHPHPHPSLFFVKAIALQGDKYFLLKMASVKLATVTSSIKGFHAYRRSPDIGDKLKCVLEETNRHSNTTTKFVGMPMKQFDIYLMDYLRWLHQH